MSVIIPTNRSSPFLVEALDSVVAQTYPHWEVIIVDDGSPNPEWLEAQATGYPALTLMRISPSGTPIAMNSGVVAARGTLVAFLGDDDVWPPDWLHAHVRMHTEHPEAVLTYAGIRSIDEHGVESHRDPLGPIEDVGAVFRRGVAILGGTTVAKRAALLSLGGFNPAFRQAQDLELAYRVAERSVPVYVPGVLLGYRRHAGNVTRNHRELVRTIDRIIDLHKQVASAAGHPEWVKDHAVGRAANTRFALWSTWRAVKEQAKTRSLRGVAADIRWGLTFLPRAPIAWALKARQRRSDSA